MPSRTAHPLHSRTDAGVAGRTTPVRPTRALALLVALVVLVLLSLPATSAGTFPVLEEQVRIGTTTGTAGAQAVDGLRETLAAADVATDLTTAPVAQNVTAGSAVAGVFPANVSTADGVYAQYRETSPGPVTVMSNPATTGPGCTWTACDSGRLPDNVSASSPTGTEMANYTSFSLNVPGSSVVTSVYLGYEAFDPTGNDHLSMALSWDGGTAWCPTVTTGALPAADPNTYTLVNVTACTGHTWSPADFGANLTVRYTHAVLGGADTINLDANVVRVTYTLSTYQLNVHYDWSGVPAGVAYVLALKGHTVNHSIAVDVLTPPSSWTPRLWINATTDANLSYTLAASEAVSGNASIRFVDANGSSPTPTDLFVDLAEVVSVQHAYRLDVLQNVTGITGTDPMLVIDGNISAGGGNFDVFLWDFSTSAWRIAVNASFTVAQATYAVSLTGSEISGGIVRIDFRNHEPASLSPTTLALDFVGVETTDAAAPIPWALIAGGVGIVGVVVAVLIFFVFPRRKRSAPEASEEAPAATPPSGGLPAAEEPSTVTPITEEMAPAASVAAPQAAEVRVVTAGDLEAGHAYLIAEDEPEAALHALESLTRMGRSGLVVTRRHAADVVRLAQPRHTTTLVLGDTSDAVAGLVTKVTEAKVLSAIDDFLGKNPVGVVLLDRLGSLAGPDGLFALVDAVQRTAARVSRGQQILLASTDSRSLGAPDETPLREPFELVRLSSPRAV